MMRKKRLLVSVIGLLILSSGVAMAASPKNNSIAVATKIGTLGLGIELVKKLPNNFTLRGGVNYLNLSHSTSFGGVDYDADVDLQAFSLFADWHPNNSKFFLSAGVLLNGYELTGKGTQTGNITVGNNSFTGSSAQFNTNVKFDQPIPYLGIGYQKMQTKGLSWTAEAGVLFQNDFEVKLDVETPTAAGVTQNDVDIERQQIINDVEDIKYFPMLSFGITYQY